ncbi:MAG: ammonium transporter, partial [Nitrososphaerales archaeon]
GALYGNLYQLGIQAFAAAVVIVYVFVVTFALLKLIGRFMPLQESQEKLRIGDKAIHGEIAYDDSPIPGAELEAEVVAKKRTGE